MRRSQEISETRRQRIRKVGSDLKVMREADSTRHVGRGQACYFGSGVRTERPKPKAQMVDRQDGVLGDGVANLLPTSSGICGIAVSSPAELVVGQVLGTWPPSSPFKSAFVQRNVLSDRRLCYACSANTAE